MPSKLSRKDCDCMNEFELDNEYEYEEPMESLEYLAANEAESDNEERQEEELWEDIKPQKTARRPRKKKIVIPDNAHPLEVFMLSKDFGWGELTGITCISKEVLLGIIRGDSVTAETAHRIRCTTGVKLCG